MICQNIGLTVRERIDKLNFKFLLTVNMYLNMSMIAYRLISIEDIHFQIDLLSKCFVYSVIRFFPYLSISLYSLNKIKGNFVWSASLQFFKHVTQTAQTFKECGCEMEATLPAYLTPVSLWTHSLTTANCPLQINQ